MTRYGETGNTGNFIDTRDDPRTVEYLSETFKPRNDGEFCREGHIRCLRIGPQTTRPPKGGLSSIREFAMREKSGAGEGARTLDPDLGKVVLYH